MSVSLVINGQTFNYPQTGDSNWGVEATGWASAVTSGMLQKAGGTFTLLSDVDFGASFGLKSLYYKTRTASIADAGQFRLARGDTIQWRNQAADGNLSLSVTSSNELQFNGINLQNFVTVSDTSSIDLTLTAGDLSGVIAAGGIVNAMVNASAAIALTKLAAMTASRAVVSDGSGFLVPATTTATEIGYVNGVTSAIQTQLDGKQTTGNYITALTGNVTASGPGSVAATIAAGVIVNSMISASAAIAFSKLATLTSGNILVGSAGNVATSVAMSGDVAIIASGATTIQTNVVTNAKLAQMATHTIKGNKTGGTANAADLTGTEVTALLVPFVGDGGSGGTQGLVPAPLTGDATKFLRGDGVFETPTGSGDVVGPASAVANNAVLFDGTSGKLIKDSGLPYTNIYVQNTSQTANVRASEGSGTTTLTIASNPIQIFNLSADRTVILPTTGVAAGAQYTIVNRNAFVLTIQASDTSQIALSYGTSVQITALSATPVANSAWAVTNITYLTSPATIALVPNSGAFGTVSGTNYEVWRTGAIANICGAFLAGTVAGGDAYLTIPSGFTYDNTLFGAANRALGTFWSSNTNNGEFFSDGGFGMVGFDGTNTDRAYFFRGATDATTWRTTPGNNAGYFRTGCIVNFSFSFPITQWRDN